MYIDISKAVTERVAYFPISERTGQVKLFMREICEGHFRASV